MIDRLTNMETISVALVLYAIMYWSYWWIYKKENKEK
jgi:hypothetical protein